MSSFERFQEPNEPVRSDQRYIIVKTKNFVVVGFQYTEMLRYCDIPTSNIFNAFYLPYFSICPCVWVRYDVFYMRNLLN